jgi:hypothetical protein
MADLISRAAALEVIEAVKNVSWSQSGKVLCGKMYSQIKDLPAVGAVPVIRCRDCKHSIENAKHIDVACERSYDPDFYCAAGERRDENETGRP